MLSLSNIESFRDTLKQLLVQCDELCTQRQFDKLWKSANDYENAKIGQKYMPDEYYKVRLFDKYMNLRFNNRTKCYYVYLENCFPSQNFQKYFPPTKSIQDSFSRNSRYYLYDDFDTSVSTFILLVHDIFTQIKKNPDLLYDINQFSLLGKIIN